MTIETNDSTAQMRMTKTEYAERCAELDKRDIVNLVTCRHHLRVLLDNIAQGRDASVEQIDAAQSACVASEADSEETHRLVWDVEIVPDKLDQIEMPLDGAA